MLGTWNAAWEHWYRRLLPAYWVFLFCVTHLPKLELPLRVPQPDKLAHFVAFGLLAFLLWKFAESYRRPVAAGFCWRALLILLAYAAVDEWLQQFVGRSTSLIDFLADAAGIGVVLTLLEWHRRRAAAPRAHGISPTGPRSGP